jgi:hypothetical protein
VSADAQNRRTIAPTTWASEECRLKAEGTRKAPPRAASLLPPQWDFQMTATTRLMSKVENARRIVRTRGIWNFSGELLRRLDRGTNWQITRWPRWMWWAMRMRANKGVCSIELNNNWLGFFAQMAGALLVLQYCDRYGLIPDPRMTGVYGTPEKELNWLYHYFDRADAIPLAELAKRVRYTKKITWWHEVGPPVLPKIDIPDGARILHKYLRIKPHIQSIVDGFWRSHDLNGLVVGVHFRGTDKATEAPRVSWSHMLSVVQNCLDKHDTAKAVFVASDEQEFIDFMKSSAINVPIYSHDDYYRSRDGRPVHTTIGQDGGYERGEDALVNALLLAKCAVLIRTTSFLSAWASLFNPELKVILLNKPYAEHTWYPESEIMKQQSTEYYLEDASNFRDSSAPTHSDNA